MDAGLSTPWQCSVVIGLKSHTCLAGALNGLAARAARRSAVLTGPTPAFFESSLREVPALNVSLREANSICSTSGIGRSLTVGGIAGLSNHRIRIRLFELGPQVT